MKTEPTAAFLVWLRDIGVLAPVDEISAIADTIDEFRFLFGLLPIEVTLALGLHGDCYGWVMWTLARGCDRRSRVFDVYWSFFPPDSLAADDWPCPPSAFRSLRPAAKTGQ